MYDYIWDSEAGGYLLTTGSGKFVANEIRPAFAQELALTGLNRGLRFDPQKERPLLWAQKNAYYYNGVKIAECQDATYGQPMNIVWRIDERLRLYESGHFSLRFSLVCEPVRPGISCVSGGNRRRFLSVLRKDSGKGRQNVGMAL